MRCLLWCLSYVKYKDWTLPYQVTGSSSHLAGSVWDTASLHTDITVVIIILQCPVFCYFTVPYVPCCTILHCTLLYYTIPYVPYCTIYYTTLYCTVLYCIVRTVLYSTVLYWSVLYFTVNCIDCTVLYSYFL